MRVNCDVCGGEPAAVLCCADEAALCTSCDRRVHRANKLACKHRRIPLIHPSVAGSDDSAAGPICDVCKERRGLVFCVEDRAILCADCDDPIHSANDLTAKHSRFLLVGAKLSSEQAKAPSSPDSLSAAQEDGSSVVHLEGSDNNSAMISDYLTNICPGWRVDDLLFDDSPFSAAATEGALLKDADAASRKHKAGRDELEHVPSMDADLFDVVAGRSEKRGAAWGPSSWTGDPGSEEVPTISAMADPTTAAKQGRVRETFWNSDNDSDAFAVPEITPPPPKKARPSSFWCL